MSSFAENLEMMSFEKWKQGFLISTDVLYQKLNILRNKTKFIPDHLKDIDVINTFFTQLSQNNYTPKTVILNFYKII